MREKVYLHGKRFMVGLKMEDKKCDARLTVHLPDFLAQKFMRIALKEGKSYSMIMRELIYSYCED